MSVTIVTSVTCVMPVTLSLNVQITDSSNFFVIANVTVLVNNLTQPTTLCISKWFPVFRYLKTLF